MTDISAVCLQNLMPGSRYSHGIIHSTFNRYDRCGGLRESGVLSSPGSESITRLQVSRYMAVILSELPNAASLEQIESLLPWNLASEQVNDRHAKFPTP